METSLSQTPASPPMNAADKLFLLFLSAMLALVCWLGVINYGEGLKTEDAKRNGEVWLAWFAEAGANRFDTGYAEKACAGGEAPVQKGKPSASATWGACAKHLLSATPLKDLLDPFTGNPHRFVSACNPTDHTLVGAIVLENLIPTPPGSPTPFVAGPLLDTEPIDRKLQVRVTICDKDSNPIKIGEAEF